MPRIEVLPLDNTKTLSTQLNRLAFNTYSQAGEDGIIAAIFDLMPAKESGTARWCVEFGAWDGLHLSNTARLIAECGWNAVLIEGESARCDEILKNHPYPDRVFPKNRWVGFDRGLNTVDDILAETEIPTDFDFLSIDVDSIDWHIWESIENYHPAVVCVEFNPAIPNNVVFVQDRDTSINEGNSLAAMVSLGKAKGYELVCVTGNAFFVRSEFYSLFSINDNSLDAMRPDRGNYLWCCYNGKIYHTLPKMHWWGRQIALRPDSLQLLREFQFHGRSQGFACDLQSTPPINKDERNLDNPLELIEELYTLRSERATIDAAIFSQRQARAWAKVKALAMQNRATHTVEGGSEP